MATEQEMREQLKEVIDPELGINVVDLGLIYEVQISDDGVADIKMTLTTQGCPMHDTMSEGVRASASKLSGIRDVRVQIVWSPAWNPEMMSDDAKAMLRRR